MRSIDLFRSAAVVLLLFLLLRAGPVSLAQSPTPTPQPKSVSSPRAPSLYYFYLPLILGPQPILKKGVPLTYPDQDCPYVAALNAFWQYSWMPNPANCPGIENVPMISVASEVNSTLGGNSEWIMGFNEPDNTSQSNLTPSQAASLWRQIEQKYQTRKLLSPASNGDTPNWLLDFRNAYIAAYGTAPRLDGIGVHCYRWLTSQCIDWIQQNETWASSWGVPEIWVTEFSFASNPNCGYGASLSQAMQMQQSFIDWMEGQPQVTRFAWFASRLAPGTELPPCFYTPLIDWNTGQPSSYGNVYLPYR